MTDSVKALKAQLMQLETLRNAGALSEAALQESKSKLERRLLDLVMQGDDTATAGAAQVPSPWKLWLACGTFTLAVAIAGYAWKGSPALAVNPPAAQADSEISAGRGAPDAAQLAAMVTTLEERLKSQPEDGVGWAMLGRTYVVLGKLPDALQAYKKALALRTNDADLLADYANALAYSRQGDVTGEPLQLVTQALKLEPANTKALAIAGSFAFAQGDFARAVLHWEKLLGMAPPGTPVDELERAIGQAKERLAASATNPSPSAVTPGASAGKTPTTSPSAGSGASVSGVVTLAAQLVSQVRPEDSVFVYARATDGSRMPLAVVRRQVKDLPLTFSLDDSMAMAPGRVLSAAGQVIISARISRSGNAMPQPGDIAIEIGPVNVGSKGLRLELGAAIKP